MSALPFIQCTRTCLFFVPFSHPVCLFLFCCCEIWMWGGGVVDGFVWVFFMLLKTDQRWFIFQLPRMPYPEFIQRYSIILRKMPTHTANSSQGEASHLSVWVSLDALLMQQINLAKSPNPTPTKRHRRRSGNKKFLVFWLY